MSFLVDEKAYHEHLFCFSSYYKYILHAISVLSNRSFSEYLKRLEEISIEMKRGIYSWKLERRYMLFTKWVFWILASKNVEHDCEISKGDMKITFDLLKDTRIQNFLNCKISEIDIDFSRLIDFLENPDSIKEFSLPDRSNVIKIGW